MVGVMLSSLILVAAAKPMGVDIVHAVGLEVTSDIYSKVTALSALASAAISLIGLGALLWGGYLTYQQVKLVAQQVNDARDMEAKRRAVDLMNEIDGNEMQDLLKTIFPTGVIDTDAKTAQEKFKQYLGSGKNMSDLSVDRAYHTAVIRLANYFDKADLFICSLLADQEMFLNLYGPTVIKFYETFRCAYFENPAFPPPQGLKRLAKKAIEHYRAVHTGVPDPQLAAVDII